MEKQKATEQRYEIKTIEVDMICPKCGKGQMRPYGLPQGKWHNHLCNQTMCNYQEQFELKKYPYQLIERVAL
jgi:hypothetical protein